MQTNLPRIDCVIFDIDGTLTRTNELIFASFNYLAQKHLGRRFTPQEIIGLFGPPEEGALRKVFAGEDIDALMDDLCGYYRDHHQELAGLHPGMEDILKFLQAKSIRMAVFTGKGKRTADITLKALNIDRYFDMVVSGNDVIRHKPDPEGIRKVLQAFAVEPEHVIMVGDSAGDIAASHGAGVRAAAVLWDTYDRERVVNASAEYVFESVAEMLEWFRKHVN